MNNKNISKALYVGKIPVGELDLDCAVLEDGNRVISRATIFKSFQRPTRGNRDKDPYMLLENDKIQLPAFLAASNLIPYIQNNELSQLIIPIKYELNQKEEVGYKAEILPFICELYLQARRDNNINRSQIPLAEKAEILLSAFAKVGIIALIDEATGYQKDRKYDALRVLLETYIEEGIQKWIKMFPDRFFLELDRLYKNEPTKSSQRPLYYGGFINTFVYNPIEYGFIKKELNRVNIDNDGKRKARFHQWLTEVGKTQLSLQIGLIIGLMSTSNSIEIFKLKFEQSNGDELSLFPNIYD